MYFFHRAVYTLLRPLVALFLLIRFGYRYRRVTGLPENYIVLANHATNFDPLFVAVAFPHLYFVGSEHISRWGFPSRLLKFFLSPILRPKGAMASATVKEVLHTLRSGKSVCLFAEGSCSWDGRPGPILPSTGKMVQKARCGLVTYRLTGGFFACPRWSTGGRRRGPVSGGSVRVYTAQQLADMTPDEINRVILHDLHEDAYIRQQENPRPYRGKRAAEGLEYLLFRCPVCGGLDALRTRGDRVECLLCGNTMHYDSYGMLRNAPFDTLKACQIWQEGETAKDALAGRTYTDPGGTLVRVADGTAVPVAQGPVSLSPDALLCGDTAIAVDEISDLDIHGKNVIVFTAGKTYYELTPSGNGLKFVMLYRHYAKVPRRVCAAD